MGVSSARSQRHRLPTRLITLKSPREFDYADWPKTASKPFRSSVFMTRRSCLGSLSVLVIPDTLYALYVLVKYQITSVRQSMDSIDLPSQYYVAAALYNLAARVVPCISFLSILRLSRWLKSLENIRNMNAAILAS